MERWSAVFIPGLWLQWCMRSAGPNTSERPNIVVFGAGDDAPIEQLDRAAVRAGLRRGMSLALAKSCCPDVVVHRCDKRTRDEAREAIATALHTWTPKVEPSSTHPGVFLLDPSGMHNFWGSHETWFSEIRRGLRYAIGLGHARGVVGWSREGVCLLARLHRGDLDIEDRSSEHRLLAQIPLVRAGWLSPRTRQGFHDVGVETVADLLRLQEASVRERLGEEAAGFHRALSTTGAGQPPLKPHHIEEALSVRSELDWQLEHLDACQHAIFRALRTLERRALERREELLEVSIRLEDREGVGVTLEARSTRPTNDLDYWERVLGEKLQHCNLDRRIDVIEASATTARRRATSQTLTKAACDLDAGQRALEQIEATFGRGCVGVLAPRDSPFIEEQTRVERWRALREPSPPSRRGSGVKRWARVLLTSPSRVSRTPSRRSDVHLASDPWRGIWRRYHQERQGSSQNPRLIIEDRKSGAFWLFGFA